MTAPQIDIYTDMLCSYCALAKRLLKAKNISFHEIDVTSDSNARAEMRKRAEGRRTVPQIFIDDMYIGGYDDLYLLDKKGPTRPTSGRTSDNLSAREPLCPHLPPIPKQLFCNIPPEAARKKPCPLPKPLSPQLPRRGQR